MHSDSGEQRVKNSVIRRADIRRAAGMHARVAAHDGGVAMTDAVGVELLGEAVSETGLLDDVNARPLGRRASVIK